MTHECNPWLGKIATLKAARTQARGIAPHKPLMLLTVIGPRPRRAFHLHFPP